MCIRDRDHTYPLRRKWEDIISFRADVHLIGCGYDSESIYLINREIGVIKIATTAVNQHFDLPEARFIKSHINQAIYFSGESSNPIEFNLPSELELERVEIESDLLASSEDILLSKSEYIPPKLSSLEQHLNVRVELYKNLLSFTKKNFIHRISPQLKLNLIENFEILNCALNFCSFIGKSDALKALWEKVLTSIKIAEEDLFLHQVNKFPKIFSQFLQELTETIYPSSDLKFKGFCADLIITCIYKACLEEGENHYRYSEFEMDVSEVSSIIPVSYTHLDVYKRQDQYLQQVVSREKDVEGLNHVYYQNMYHNVRFLDDNKQLKSILPCTPLAVVKILEYLKVYNNLLPQGNRLYGKKCVVVNRSEIVGRPLAALLALSLIHI